MSFLKRFRRKPPPLTPEQFLQFADPLPDPTLLVSGSGLILAANRAIVDRFGIALSDLQNRPLGDFVHDPAGTLVQYLTDCSLSRKMVPGAIDFVGTGGRHITCRAEGAVLSPAMNDSEALLLVRLMAQESATGQLVALNQRIAEPASEIGRSEQAEEARRQSEEMFRTLAESIPQLAWMARPDGHLFWYNRRWYEYTGTTFDQMEGWGWQSVHDPNELPRVIAKFKAALAGGEAWEDTFPLRRHDGAMRWHLSRMLPLRDESGSIVRWFGTNTDITERLETERALKESDRRKDEFLATLAHELRNPLAPIRNGLEILRFAGVGDEEKLSVHAMMAGQLNQIVRLVDDLIDISRINIGKIDLRIEQVQVGSLIRRAVEMTTPVFDAKKQRLIVRLLPEDLIIDGDSTRLTQVLSNLLNNASKYTPEGGQIELSAARLDKEIEFRVRDDGIGIPAEMLSRIFDMFTQVDSGTEAKQAGLGIGLTLARRLVEMHGGTLKAVSSGAGKGSEFIVRLPVSPSPKTDESPTQGRERVTPENECRILVVDDNVVAARSMARLLQISGHEVQIAHDGPTAIELAASFLPRIILLDIGMPGMNGYEVARRIRGTRELGDVVLAALTGWGQDEDRRRSQEAGFDLHLVKPVDFEAIQKVLEQVCP